MTCWATCCLSYAYINVRHAPISCRWDTKLVISDVDGTITKSDLLGHLLPALGMDWSHAGISKLFTNVAGHGYQVGVGALRLQSCATSLGMHWSHAGISKLFTNVSVHGHHVGS